MPGARTDAAEAQEFVTGTGVDALAVAVGTSHAMTTRDATLDLALIAAFKRAVPVPLVLHGFSGVADDDLVAGMEAAMTRVNTVTHLNQVFNATVRTYLDVHPEVVDTRKYLGAARGRPGGGTVAGALGSVSYVTWRWALGAGAGGTERR